MIVFYLIISNMSNNYVYNSISKYILITKEEISNKKLGIK